jgi:hypothetical protein
MVGIKRAPSPDSRFAAKRLCEGIHVAEPMELTPSWWLSSSGAITLRQPLLPSTVAVSSCRNVSEFTQTINR